MKYVKYDLVINEQFSPKNVEKFTPEYTVQIESLDMNPTHPKYVKEEKDIAIGVKLALTDKKGTVYYATPIVLLRDNNIYQLPTTVNELGIRIHAGSDIFDQLFKPTNDLKFNEYVKKEGDSFKVGNKTVTITGVNPNAKTDHGMTVLELAKSRGWKRVVGLLQRE